MLAHYEPLRKARLSALEQFHKASTMHIDAVDRMLRMYSGTVALTLNTLRSYEASSGLEPLGRVMLHMLEGHIRLADHTHADFVRLLESHAHGVGYLARESLKEASLFSPPLMEKSLDAADILVATGESVAKTLGDVTIDTLEYIENKIEHKERKRSKSTSRSSNRIA